MGESFCGSPKCTDDELNLSICVGDVGDGEGIHDREARKRSEGGVRGGEINVLAWVVGGEFGRRWGADSDAHKGGIRDGI